MVGHTLGSVNWGVVSSKSSHPYNHLGKLNSNESSKKSVSRLNTESTHVRKKRLV